MTTTDPDVQRLADAAGRVGLGGPDRAKVRRLRDLQAEMIDAGRAAAHRQQAHHRALKDVDDQWQLDATAKNRGREIEWEKFTADAGAARLNFATIKAEYADLLAELTAPHRQPGGLKEEMARQAAWTRLQRTLDSTDHTAIKYAVAQTILEAAAKVGDAATLEAARRELPSYLVLHNEQMPEGLAVWLDLQAGPDFAGDARTVEMSNGKDLTAAEIALNQLDQAARTHELSDALAYPNGIEGQRVVGLDGQTDFAR